MREVQARLGEDIQLGRRGENLAVCVTFDVGDWPGATAGTVQLIHQRNGDDHPYPCAITVEGGVATWVITEADVAVAGRGRAELQYLKGETCIKSAIYTTNTLRALGRAGAAPPEPEEGWVSKVLEAGGSAMASAEAAQRSEVNAKNSETNAKQSEEVVKASAASAASSANIASTSAANAKASETAAKASEDSAKAAQAAAEKARDDTVSAVEGDFATRIYVADEIAKHDGSSGAHSDIRQAVTEAKNLAAGKADGNHKHTAADVGAVPATRKINNKALSTDISLNASDVGARSNTWMPTAAEVGAVPTIAKYYAASVNISADDLTDPLALIPVSTTVNTELYNVVGGTFAYVRTMFYGGAETTRRRVQVAYSYNTTPTRMAIRLYGPIGWLEWREMAGVGDLAEYLPRDGSAPMTNTLSVMKASTPILQLWETTNNSAGVLQHNNHTTLLTAANVKGDGKNSRGFRLLDSAAAANVKDALTLSDTVNGATTHYNILHTGNVTAGTTDLTAGSSALATGAIYQVYE